MTFNDTTTFFETLNSSGQYVILRNFENFPESLILDNHPDIDILCESSSLFINQLELQNRAGYKDNIHFCVLINQIKVDVDLREFGDGYYDEKWERHIIEHRVKYSNFYIPSRINYFYSLLYHAKIQKRILADEYMVRLLGMADELGLNLSFDNNSVLDDFMRAKGYRYTYPISPKTTFITDGVDKYLIEKNFPKMISRYLYRIRRKIARV